MTINDDRLIGIKAIADYLSMSVRNVYNWEKKLGMPLHRISEGGGFRIYAYKSELDRWLKKKDESSLKKKKNTVSILIPLFSAILVLIMAFYLSSRLQKKNEASQPIFNIDKNIVYIKDNKGNVIWHFSLKSNIEENVIRNFTDFRDIDHDSQKEIIACTYNFTDDKHFITLFDPDKGVLWEKSVESDIKFNGIEIDNFFRPGPVKFAKSDKYDYLIISKWNHMERFLSIVACHDLDGNLLYQYLHTGNLSASMEIIDLDNDGNDEIIFTGTNNLLNGEGILGVLSVTGFSGISPPYRVEPEYAEYGDHLQNYIPDEIIKGDQMYYLRFKRTSDLSKYREIYINTEVSYSSKEVIQIKLFPWRFDLEKQLFGFDYIFDHNFSLQEVLPQTFTLNNYPKFLDNKEIDIPIEKLKRIYASIVFRWENDQWVPVKCLSLE